MYAQFVKLKFKYVLILWGFGLDDSQIRPNLIYDKNDLFRTANLFRNGNVHYVINKEITATLRSK